MTSQALQQGEAPPDANLAKQASGFPDRDPDVFYELAKDRLAAQLALIDALDNKIGLLFSLSSGLLGILAGVLALRGGQLDLADWITVGASTGVYVLVAFWCQRAYFGRDWDAGPSLQEVYDDLFDRLKDDKRLKWGLAADFWNYHDNNLPAQKAKQCLLRPVLAGVTVQTLTLVLTLFLVAAGV